MAYGFPYQSPTPNYFNTNYMPPSFTAQPQQPQQPPMPQTNVSWIYVNGVQGARDHIVQPGQTAWMMDNNDPIIHVKAVDNMGSATLKSFLLTEIDAAQQTKTQQPVDMSQYVTKADLQAVAEKLAKLEEEIGGLNG